MLGILRSAFRRALSFSRNDFNFVKWWIEFGNGLSKLLFDVCSFISLFVLLNVLLVNVLEILLFDSFKYFKCGARLKNSSFKSMLMRWLFLVLMMCKFDVFVLLGGVNVLVNVLFEMFKIFSNCSEKSFFGKFFVKRFEFTLKVLIFCKWVMDGLSDLMSVFLVKCRCFKCCNFDSDFMGMMLLNEFLLRFNMWSDFIWSTFGGIFLVKLYFDSVNFLSEFRLLSN